MFTPKPVDRRVEGIGELTWMNNWKHVAMMPFMPPFRFRDHPGDRVPLTELARILGVSGPGIEESLQRHERVLTARWRTAYLLYLIAVLVITGLMLLGLVSLEETLQTLWDEDPVAAAAGGLALMVLAYLYAVGSFRAATLLSDRYYAETLSAISALYILAELCRDEPITSPVVKRMLLIRMGYLARSLLLLSFPLPVGSATQTWVTAHFAEMFDYVRERERWVLAPVAATAEVLRQDLALLAPILVLGTYGEFSWPTEPRKRHLPPRSKTAVTLVMLKRGLGFILPVVVLSFALKPGVLPPGVAPSIILFVLLTWFLLAVNGMFRLGVIESFVNVAKAIKDLK
ncbi:MAG TPA: hypothetical protein VEX86_14855 [Longimicrobium sp.]|nr:hypothetical protein [Longimicrobium sp.]